MAIAKWYKVDFHAHTPESRCFADKTVTAESWLSATKASGLNAVVITDHNSVRFLQEIENIKSQYEEENKFKVFYGIELCVSAELTHIIIIFDDTLSITKIEDAVIAELGLPREDWNNTEKYVTEDKLKELCRTLDYRVFIIPAHFASNKGLGKVNVNAIKRYMEFVNFAAVEVRNDEDIREYKNKVAAGAIKKCALISGSDNPTKEDSSSHGIDGFGSSYTWVKLSRLNFSGLHQVFLDPEYRCINYLDAKKYGEEFNPNNVTHNYIAGVVLKGFRHIDDISLRFSPHLNCIIGGRGTGKSTIIESIRVALKGSTTFEDKSLVKGTLNINGVIDTYYKFGSSSEYLISASKIKKNEINISYTNSSGEVKDPPEFSADIYGQKEIFSLVEQDGDVNTLPESPLVKMIDEEISHKTYDIKDGINTKVDDLLKLSQKIASIRAKLKEISSVKADIAVIESSLQQFKLSGLEEVRQKYDSINKLYQQAQTVIKGHSEVLTKLNQTMLSGIKGSDEFSLLTDDIKNQYPITIEITDAVKQFYAEVAELCKTNNIHMEKLENALQQSTLAIDRDTCKTEYDEAVEMVRGTGISNVKELQDKLSTLKEREEQLQLLKSEQDKVHTEIVATIDEFIELRLALSEERHKVAEENSSGKLLISIAPLAHKMRWKLNLQKEFGKENIFDAYFDTLCDYIFDETDTGYDNLKNYLLFLLISKDGQINSLLETPISESRFVRLWADKQEKGTLNSLIKILPEDLISIKLVEGTEEIDINEGSPGQKCAAILAFILNNGKRPLIIDQPEDDLDNSLIYNLIVSSIRQMKTSRQIVIITHNPNIPVLGDAEGIIILERDINGKVCFREGKKTGCLEEALIRDGICEIMEGGKDAFKRREEKYQYNN